MKTDIMKKSTGEAELKICRQCKAEFKNIDDEDFIMCLDCRSNLSDIARRPNGQDCAEWMSQKNLRFRLKRGFNLLSMEEDE